MFSIGLLTRTDGLEPDEALGVIEIGSFSEKFIASLSYWSRAEYERHWQKAIKRILDGEACSGLITSITDPSSANFFTWWPLYRLGGEVAIQNQLLFLDALDGPFDIENPFRHVKPRSVVNDEGFAISEWHMGIKELVDFYWGRNAVNHY